MIVDAESDLNVYVELAKDTEAMSGDAAGCCGKSAPGAGSAIGEMARCCSKAENGVTSRGDTPISSTTPAGKKQAGCCVATSSGTQNTDVSLADIDINEWAGECLFLIALFSYLLLKGHSKSLQ